MVKISIIIPAYNAAKTIRRCLESIIHQTFENFECIVINDGSSDLTSSICHDYVLKDSRIIVVDKENGGVSSARNLGITLAKGQYVTFVDSDDYVDVGFLNNFITIENDSDIVLSCAYTYVQGTNFSARDEHIYYHGSISKSGEFINKLYFSGYTNMPWGKFFRLSFIQQKNISFDLNYQYGEDILFTLDCLNQASYITVSSIPGYNYVFSKNGLSRNNYSYEVILKWNDILLSKWTELKERMEYPMFVEAIICNNFTFYTYYLQNNVIEDDLPHKIKIARLSEIYTRHRDKIKLVNLNGKKAVINKILYWMKWPQLTLAIYSKHNFRI